MQKLEYKQKDTQDKVQIFDLNNELDYRQPFKTPTLIFGKETNNRIDLKMYTMGIQKHIFWGYYLINEDVLYISNICKYEKLNNITKLLENIKIDGYKLLNDVAKNNTPCNYVYDISNAYDNKTNFSFLDYVRLNEYIDIIFKRMNYKDKEKHKSDLFNIFCKHYVYGLFLYSIYINSMKITDSKDNKDILEICPNINSHIKNSYQNKFNVINRIDLIKDIDDLYDGKDYTEVNVNDKVFNIDSYLFICLNYAIAHNEILNMSKSGDLKYIMIVKHLEKREFINKDSNKICPDYDYCTNNYRDNELCELYTNFLL